MPSGFPLLIGRSFPPPRLISTKALALSCGGEVIREARFPKQWSDDMRSTFGHILIFFSITACSASAFAEGGQKIPMEQAALSISSAAGELGVTDPDAAHADLTRIVERQAREHGIPRELVESVIQIESGWQKYARNGSAVGLMQIKASTARMLGYNGTTLGLFEPETNIAYGVKYLAKAFALSEGDLCHTLMRYQSGHEATRMSAQNRTYCARARVLIASNGN